MSGGTAALPELALLIWAGGLVVLAGLIAMTDAALGAVSVARAAALARGNAATRSNGSMRSNGATRGNGRNGGHNGPAPPWGATALVTVAADKPRYRNLLVLLRLACELTATTLVALVAVGEFGLGWAAALVTAGTMTVVSFVVVGIGPRILGQQHAYTVGRLSAPTLRGLVRALGPLTALLLWVGNVLTPGRGGGRDDPFASPAGGEPDITMELRELVDLAEQQGAVEHGERDMIHSVFQLGDTVAREVMVPRTEMVWIEAHKSLRQALTLALRSGFSRIPVIGATVDDVLGVAYLKDLARRTAGGDASLADSIRVDAVMRPAVFVPASKPVDDLLQEMRAARVHMVVVVDEYGGTAGLVTIEDILEEIVGEITDEYDVELPPVQWQPDGSARVSARLPIEDLAELFDTHLEAAEVETVAGLLAQALGKVPIPGANATVGGLRLVAEGAAGRRNRIQTLLISRVPESAEGEADGPATALSAERGSGG